MDHFSIAVDNIAVFKLINIPLKKFDVINQRTSYDGYFFRINIIILNEKEVEKNIKSLTYHPFYDYLNGDFINKWGGYWNLNLYRMAKKELHIAIAASLLEDLLLLHHSLRNESIYLKIRRFIARILLKDLCLNIIFWSLVILGVARVTHEGTLASKYLSVGRCRRFLKLNYLKFRA